MRALVDDDVHGILVQFPLPDGLDPEPVIALIPPEKDVDGLTERSMGRLVRGVPAVGCTPLGVMRLLDRYGVRPRAAGRGGRSLDARRPAAGVAARPQGCRRHRDAGPLANPRHGRGARGRHPRGSRGPGPHDHRRDVKPGATVIDVGVSRTESGIVGDVDFEPVAEVAGAITPMPGGTGPMTIACLLENTLTAAQLQGAFPT